MHRRNFCFCVLPETTGQEVAILKFLEMETPEVIAPRVLGYDTEPQNPIAGSPFILVTSIFAISFEKSLLIYGTVVV
jgi:hypothetical protein